MSRANKVMVILVVLVLGLWGCAKGPANRGGQVERMRALEARCAKLEEDYRTAAAARDQARKQAGALEEENAQLQKDLASKANIAKERDDVQQQLKVALADRDDLRGQVQQRTGERDEARQLVDVRTNERDTWQSRHDHFRKGLQSLLSQDDPQSPTVPAGPSTIPTTSPGQNGAPALALPANGQS